MSNFKNAFGNDGWFQSMIDRSRGKTRPGRARRRAERRDVERRKGELRDDPLFQKYGNEADLQEPNYSGKQTLMSTVAGGRVPKKGLFGLMGRALEAEEAKKKKKPPPRGVY